MKSPTPALAQLCFAVPVREVIDCFKKEKSVRGQLSKAQESQEPPAAHPSVFCWEGSGELRERREWRGQSLVTLPTQSG